METLLEPKTATFEIEKIEVDHLPELQGLREKQIQIISENPFVSINDNKTYEDAKKARTALVTARTSIENQDKFLASLVKKFREKIATKTSELISITKPHEEKQQSEVKRWEAEKEAEKQEKLRIEEERKNKIKTSIDLFFQIINTGINSLSFENIESFSKELEEKITNTDTAAFEEFELDFNEKLITIKNTLFSKTQQLQLNESQRLENIRLKEEADKLATERAKMEADRIAEEKRLAKIKEDQEAELKAEREKIEAEKQKLQQIENEKAAKEKERLEAIRLEALKPEKEKIQDFINSLMFEKPFPAITDIKLIDMIQNFVKSIETEKSNFTQAINNYK